MPRLPSFRLQYASNLLVDSHKKSFESLVRPACGSLALLGNIGRPESANTYNFLKYCAKNWDTIYWCVGPHELVNRVGGRMTYVEKMLLAQKVSSEFKNVKLFATKEHALPNHNLVLLGAPLWTATLFQLKGQPEFDRIYTSVDEAGPVPLTAKERNGWYRDDLFFLKERSLFWSIVNPNVGFVYLTHTLPHPGLLRRGLSDASWSRLPMDSIPKQSHAVEPVRAWLGGATGSTASMKVGTDPATQVVCAVNGLFEYPSLKQNPDYNPECVLELKDFPPKERTRILPSPLVLPPLLSSLLKPNVSLSATSFP